MDEEVIRKHTIRKVGRKFYGHDSLYSKYTPQIPEAAEREKSYEQPVLQN